MLTREQRIARIKGYKVNRARCECGRLATVKKSGGAVCARCSKLEEYQEQRELRRDRVRQRHGYKFGGLSEHHLAVKYEP